MISSVSEDEWYEENDGDVYYDPRLSSNKGGKNDIKRLSDKIKYLVNLKVLYINGEWNHKFELSDLTPLNDLENIENLYIYNTNVVDLKPLKRMIEKGVRIIEDTYSHFGGLGYRENKNGIFIGSNFNKNTDISNPPYYIIKEGNEAILRYWQELENKETITNNQTKLIFIGNSRAGKTSLWKFLKDKTYETQADSTHGIKTEIWDTESLGTPDNQNLAAHIWDFGGQEYYHATHRLFLSDNAVYILVWENDSNKTGVRLERFKLDDDPNGEIEEVELEHFPASYWLENIRHYGGNSPRLIVQNKVDDEAQKCLHTEGSSDLTDCYHLSIQNSFLYQEGQTELEDFYGDFKKFKNKLLNLLRHNATQFKLVKYYAQVRETLEALAKTQAYIPFSELKTIALTFDETPDEQNLLAYLKSFTNTVLHFPNNPLLKDRLYLRPKEISENIYKILNKQG